MGSKHKVECRSTTGGPYSRADQLWTSEFSLVPEELLRDDDKRKVLWDDPHLEIRVDGEYRTGPRVGSAPAAGSDSALTRTIDELKTRLAEQGDLLDKNDGDLQAAKRKAAEDAATIADLTKQLDALKSTAAATAASTSPPPMAETAPDAASTKKKSG